MMKFTRGETKPKGVRLVIYGKHGIGKTTLVSKLENALILDYEDGTHGISCTKVTGDELPRSFEDLVKAVNGLAGSEFKTVVIDTMDCLTSILDYDFAQRVNPLCESVYSINDFGRTVAAFSKAFANVLAAFSRLSASGVNVVLNCHECQRKVSSTDGDGEYDHSELNINAKLSKLIMEWADAVIFCANKVEMRDEKHAKGGARWCYSVYSKAHEAKHRAFFDIPDECSLDRMADELPKAVAKAQAEPEKPDFSRCPCGSVAGREWSEIETDTLRKIVGSFGKVPKLLAGHVEAANAELAKREEA